MKSGSIPENEPERLAKLRSLDILDTLEEEAYDDLTLLAAQICDTPIALVSLIDESRQWFKSHHGLDAQETPREYAFCGHAILQEDVFVVEDTEKDDRFKNNPLVTGSPNIRFYAGAPLVLENDIRIGTLCVIDRRSREITEKQKSSLAALSRQVVAQLNLRLRLKEMHALDKAKDEFLSMVSHELRTPMTSLIGSLKILEYQSENLEQSLRPMMDIAVRNGDHLLNIVNDILDLAKMEAGKLELNRVTLDLIEVAKTSLDLNQPYFLDCECQAELRVPEKDSAILVQADKKQLQQVVTNLVSNAAKYSQRNGKIIVSIEVVNNVAELSVTDFGEGIAIAEQGKLFRKFQQLDHTKNGKHPGTGLGLNICKHILNAHYSDIEFESIPNEQTRFFFKLPVKS
ncbi:MAG: GAF domain-containing sensor histidine kinase [Acidiferrobacterales bacterium]|nr:GAF domain-containing sensor histidine kinase [Acidiferrobacterales bacterium]